MRRQKEEEVQLYNIALVFKPEVMCIYLCVCRYKDVLKKAKLHELREQDVILCTCATALSPNLIKAMDFRQILIDECAMATEPEAFIPLVSHKPEQVCL